MEIYIDKSFDSRTLGKYNLSLKIGDNFLIANASKGKTNMHVAVAESSFKCDHKHEGFKIDNFTNALKKCPVKVSKKYGKVSISIASIFVSVIPKALFSKDNIGSYLELSSKIKGTFDYRFQTLEKEGIVICYAVNKDLNNWIKKIFPNAKVTHEIAVIIESVLRDFHSLSENRVILNINKDYFDLLFLSKGKLDFVNSFLFNEKEDLLYYILFAFEQLGINPHEIEVILLGDIKKGSEQHQFLFQYIKNIHFGSRNKNIKITGGLTDLPNHYFYTVFNQILCV